jgi:hypothetical protein
VETTANWYWITDEIERANCVPRLVHPRKAKLMMGQINKTDKLDTHGLNILQRNGTLPTVWIPPGELRELRELTRTRVVLVAQRTRWKNRITATLAKWRDDWWVLWRDDRSVPWRDDRRKFGHGCGVTRPACGRQASLVCLGMSACAYFGWRPGGRAGA